MIRLLLSLITLSLCSFADFSTANAGTFFKKPDVNMKEKLQKQKNYVNDIKNCKNKKIVGKQVRCLDKKLKTNQAEKINKAENKVNDAKKKFSEKMNKLTK